MVLHNTKFYENPSSGSESLQAIDKPNDTSAWRNSWRARLSKILPANLHLKMEAVQLPKLQKIGNVQHDWLLN
jgi:hypothetical protein